MVSPEREPTVPPKQRQVRDAMVLIVVAWKKFLGTKSPHRREIYSKQIARFSKRIREADKEEE